MFRMIEDQKVQNQPQSAPDEPHHKSKPIGKIAAIIIILLLLAAVGWLAWQLWLCVDHDTKVDQQNQQLKAQVDTLKKQLDDAKKSTSTTSSPQQTAQCTAGPASQSLKDNIEAAITSKNTAALQGYMASSVSVVIAASEKGDTETPAQATKSVEYTYGGTAPWNFALPAATIASYKAGFYKQYFPSNAYVGKAANDQVVSFGFDCNGKINMIFMAANAELLM
jgi:cell division protein FtsL